LDPEPRRITLDAELREVTFLKCLWPKRFFARGPEPLYRCKFGDIHSAGEVGTGSLRRLIISTRDGRCAVSADWDGFKDLSSALRKISTVTAPGAFFDDPRILMSTVVVGILGTVGAIIYFLL
jgi:hypothetical protein